MGGVFFSSLFSLGRVSRTRGVYLFVFDVAFCWVVAVVGLHDDSMSAVPRHPLDIFFWLIRKLSNKLRVLDSSIIHPSIHSFCICFLPFPLLFCVFASTRFNVNTLGFKRSTLGSSSIHHFFLLKGFFLFIYYHS